MDTEGNLNVMKLKVRGGIDIVLAGAPRQVIREGQQVTTVALQGEDYPGVRPFLQVEVGDQVLAGQTVFVDRKRRELKFAAPASGVVKSIEYGHRRILAALIIDRDDQEALAFDIPKRLTRESVQALLLESGMWPAFLARPFGRIPDPHSVPNAIFVTAIDTNPMATDAGFVIGHNTETFQTGLELLRWLTDGNVFICQAPGPHLLQEESERLKCVQFSGRHPAGLAGTHIHRLAPASERRTVWHIGYQDVIAIGALYSTGKYRTERVIALAGPGVENPAHIRTQLGANLSDLLAGELLLSDAQMVSGSLLSGRKAEFLGRYHTQVLALPAARNARHPSWLSRIISEVKNKTPDPLIPTEALEKAIAIDVLPVPLLRALSVGDTETAHKLGALELVEEDMALLSYACASGVNYGALLRDVLNELEAGGK